MRGAPPISRLPEYPVTGAMCVLAVVVTGFVEFGGGSLEPLAMHPAAFHDEPWRLLTSTLPHGGLFHLAFNLYWTWIFGTTIEERLGSGVTGGLAALMAAGSGAAEYAVFSGGIGLSGVGYGLFGMLWVLKGRDPRFLGALDSGTTKLFVIWFFACIVLSWLGILPVANVAHGSGAAIGAALGLMVAARHKPARLQALGLNVLWVAAVGLACTVALPVVNLEGGGGRDLAYRSVQALEAGQLAEGEELFWAARAASNDPIDDYHAGVLLLEAQRILLGSKPDGESK